MKLTLVLVAILFAFLLCGCVDLTQWRAQFSEYVDRLYDSGKIDAATAKELKAMAGAAAAAAGNWVTDIFQSAATALSTLVLGYFGIRTWRGSPQARKGMVPMQAPTKRGGG